MIRLQDLSRAFKGREVLRGLSAETPSCGLVALQGRNGSGKTTLLRILSTLTEPSAGEAWVGGYSVLSDPRRARAALGYVPSTDGGMFRRLSGRENLLLFAGLCGLSAAQARVAIDRLREALPIDDALEARFGVASSGMRQSLLLCRSLIHDPEVLLLDEPTRALDASAREGLWRSLSGLAERKVILFSTHDERDCARAAAVWRIDEGRLTCSA